MVNLLAGRRYVLSFEEKRGTRHFVVLNSSELEAAALKVLSNRFKEGYWYSRPKGAPSRPSYTKEQIEDLKGPAKVAATQEYVSYKRDFKTWKEASDFVTKYKLLSLPKMVL